MKNALKSITEKNFQIISIDKLKPYARNAKKHSDAQINAIGKSIDAFGFNSPIVIAKDNTILAGHARVEAAKRNGMTKVPAVRADHLNEAEKRAFILADNRLAEKAEWDDAFLKAELLFLVETVNFDSTITGFETPEIDFLLFSEFPTTDENVVSKIEKLVDTAPRTKLGDTWILDNHRVHCGSSLEAGTINILMKNSTAALLCTAPPL